MSVTRWRYCLTAAMITRWHHFVGVEMVTGCVHWIVNVFNCKKNWIARRKHQHLQTAGKDHQLGKRDGVPQKEKERDRGRMQCFVRKEDKSLLDVENVETTGVKPGVHTNDFAPIHGRRAPKLGHALLATVFRPSRLTFQPILRENLESPVLRYQPITTAVIADACLNTRWQHGYITARRHQVAALRESLCLDRVVTVYVV